LASGAALRGEASNHPQLHWLKTVVVNVVGKVAALTAAGGGREDERWAEWLSAVDASKGTRRRRNQGRANVLGSAWGTPVYCPGGVRGTGSMIPAEALLWNV
jgi:hypothetical protein